MNTIEIIREFIGWCTVINIILLIFSTIIIIVLGGPLSRLNAKMFSLDEKFLRRTYFRYLSEYKIAIIVLNIVPYLALLIIK